MTEAKPGFAEAMVIDEETGRYVKRSVPVEVLVEPPDHFSHDPMGLGPDWDKGRGKEMHAHWANANPKYRTTENQYKYRPVDPAEVPREIRDRFMVSEVDGFEGDCLVYGDAVLVEVPNWLYKHRENKRKRIEDARNAELWGFSGDLQDMNERHAEAGRFSARIDSRVGGHIDDMADPREGLHDRAQGGYALGSSEYANACADAELEAEYESRRGSGSQSFGGFQGSPQYNNTRWSRDQRQ